MGINNRMDKKEQTQLQAATKSIAQLERVVNNLILRVALLERENAKLKSAVIKTKSDVGTLERKVGR